MSQYQKIIRLLKRRPKSGATYHDMMVICELNWPHKRIAELELKGYRFKKKIEKPNKGKAYVRIWLDLEPQQA